MVVVTGDQGVLAGPATRGSPPQVVLIAAVWVVGLILTQQAGRSLPSTRWSCRGVRAEPGLVPLGRSKPVAGRQGRGEQWPPAQGCWWLDYRLSRSPDEGGWRNIVDAAPSSALSRRSMMRGSADRTACRSGEGSRDPDRLRGHDEVVWVVGLRFERAGACQQHQSGGDPLRERVGARGEACLGDIAG